MMITDKELIGKDADRIENEENQLKEPFGSWVAKILRSNFDKYGDKPWMTDLSTGKSMTYGQLIKAVNRVGSALWNRGFRPSDTVLFAVSNHLEVAITYLAVWALEGCCASLGLDSFPDEIIQSKTKETKAKFLLTDFQRGGRFQNALRDLMAGNNIQVIVIGDERVEKCISFDDLLLEGDDMIHSDHVHHNRGFNVESPAWLGFSSGTTGEPKGIVHSQATMHLFAIYRRMGAAPNPGSKILATNGLIHGSGVCGMLDNILGYGHQFLLSETATAHSILQGIHLTKAATLCIYAHEVIQIYGLSSAEIHAKQYDLSSVHTLKVAASHILPVHKRRLAELMTNLTQLTNVYAQTETMALTAPLARSPSRADFLRLLNSPLSLSAGQVFPLVKLKFLDLITGDKVGPNEMGEIAANTPFLMGGYLNKPEESSKAIRADGWFYTGDVGYYDAEGNIFILGRISDFKRLTGSNKYVVPIKIEEQMSLHPAVKDVAVIVLVKDGPSGQPVTRAFVALKNPQEESEALLEEIETFTNENVVLEAEKIKKGNIQFIENIPRNDVGKIARSKLTKFL